MPRDTTEQPVWDVWTVPLTGGDPTLMLENAAFPSYLPNGEIVFIELTSRMTGHRIVIADEAGHRRTLFESDNLMWWPTVSPDGKRRRL